MIKLAEIAADVAAALGLESYPAGLAKKDEDFFVWLNEDGSNLTDPYWRCACEDWLHERGVICWEPDDSALMHEFISVKVGQVVLECPWPESPARLVSAVWRRMQEAKPRALADET